MNQEKLIENQSKYQEVCGIELPNNVISLDNPIICEKNKIIGTVYCFKNTINDKLYIGETVKRNFRNRFIEHHSHSETIHNYFYHAIRKYGWEAFIITVLYQTDVMDDTEENRKILNDLVNIKEKEYIQLFNTSNHEFGYNLTNGGDGILGYKFSEETKKKMSEARSGEKHWNYGNFNNSTSDIILQFDLDGNLIQEWPSMKEIERQLNCKSSNISRCCSNTLDTYIGFIWVKKNDYFDGYIQKYKSRAKCVSNDKTVLQYDFNGNFIAKYISAAEASRQLGKRSGSMINKAASGAEKQAYKFIWIYENIFSEELLKEKLNLIKNKK